MPVLKRLNGEVIDSSEFRNIKDMVIGNRDNLTEADLRNIDLSGLDLRHAVAEHADFSGSNLNKTNFNHARLADSNFTASALRKTKFNYANLQRANFSGADVTNAQFRRAFCSATEWQNANVEKSRFIKAYFGTIFIKGREIRVDEIILTKEHRKKDLFDTLSWYKEHEHRTLPNRLGTVSDYILQKKNFLSSVTV